MPTSNRTIKWIENLAEQELLIHAGERASIDICTTKDEVLVSETIHLMRELFLHFEYLVRLFNSRMSDDGLQIRLLKNNDNSNGFLLRRNYHRLALTFFQPGVIHLSCDKILSGYEDPPSVQKTSVMFSGTVEGKFGLFHDVEWYFLGSRIGPEQLARHYLTEFIQTSRQTRDF
jgi:hypothetical protein